MHVCSVTSGSSKFEAGVSTWVAFIYRARVCFFIIFFYTPRAVLIPKYRELRSWDVHRPKVPLPDTDVFDWAFVCFAHCVLLLSFVSKTQSPRCGCPSRFDPTENPSLALNVRVRLLFA